MKINKKSWHYHIVKTYTDGSPHWIESICEYNRRVLLGIFNILMIIFVSSILLICALSPIFYGILYLIYGDAGMTLLSNDGSIVFVGILMYIMAILFYFMFLYTQWRDSRIEEYLNGERIRKESYIGAAWKSFKDKVCVRVEFE